MALESEIVRLVLYATQQLGVTLAVGGQTIVLVAYLIAMRDRVVDAKEAQFSRAVKAVLFSGLGLVILSGLGITALHYLGGEISILLTPAYLFKWLLVVVVIAFSFELGKKLAPPWVGEGIVGGTWYALFLVHILAPVTTWENLLALYGGWLGAFFLIWTVLVFSTRERKSSLKKNIPLSTPPPPLQPPVVQRPLQVTKPPLPKLSEPLKPPEPPSPALAPLPNIPSVKPAFVPTPLPAIVPQKPLVASVATPIPVPTPVSPKAEDKPITPPPPKPEEKEIDPDAHPGLPAIRVMPKTPQDIETQHRAAVVKFD